MKKFHASIFLVITAIMFIGYNTESKKSLRINSNETQIAYNQNDIGTQDSTGNLVLTESGTNATAYPGQLNTSYSISTLKNSKLENLTKKYSH